MNLIIKPIVLGVGAYISSALALWFVISFALFPIFPSMIALLPAAITVVPLLLSGAVAARVTSSRYRSWKIGFGVFSGLVGFILSTVVTHWHGEIGILLMLYAGAGVVAGVGGYFVTRQRGS